MKLDPPNWMHHVSSSVPTEPVVARVWRIISCDAMHTLQLTFAPWDINAVDGHGMFDHSHLAVVDAIDERGEPHVFYVHEGLCQLQCTYRFTCSGDAMWMDQNESAPYGFFATRFVQVH